MPRGEELKKALDTLIHFSPRKPSTPAALPWEPIEKAPHDGIGFYAWHPGGHAVQISYRQCQDDFYYGEHYFTQRQLELSFTHWTRFNPPGRVNTTGGDNERKRT